MGRETGCLLYFHTYFPSSEIVFLPPENLFPDLIHTRDALASDPLPSIVTCVKIKLNIQVFGGAIDDFISFSNTCNS